MLVVELRFPTGRYHATPWDQHVNEGAVDWPPSSWRLLRALVATWHLKASEEIPEATLASIVEILALELPRYELPRVSAAHTRHYMPIGQIKDGVERTTKVFDTFVHIGTDARARVLVCWPRTTLTHEQEDALSTLLSRMAYLGRAESWVDARIVTNSDLGSATMDLEAEQVVPLRDDAALREDQELVRILSPLEPENIGSWRSRMLEQELERCLVNKRRAAEAKGKDPTKTKLTGSDRNSIEAALPGTLLEALRVDTGDLHSQGWSAAPGTRWADYARPRNGLGLMPGRGPKPETGALPTAARFALASQVPPRLTEAVSVADQVRKALMSQSNAMPVFSGRDEEGKPLRGNQHAFILPEANGSSGHITHITLYAPMGFDAAARQAIGRLRKVWGRAGHDQQLILIGIGQPEDFAGLNTLAGGCPLLVGCDTWISRTPFVPTRHSKADRRGNAKVDERGLQIGSPEHDLRRLLLEAGYSAPVCVEHVDATDLQGKRTRWLEFKTIRQTGEGARGANRGFGFRIRFAKPVLGPIAVGYGAHFGLGLFLPSAGLSGAVE